MLQRISPLLILFAVPGASAMAFSGGAGEAENAALLGAELNHDKDKGLNATLADGDIQVQFGGRIMYDLGFLSADDELKTPAAGYENEAFEFSDGSEFRRARFFAKGTLYDTIDFKAQYDFAGGDADFKDVYMQTDLGFGTLRAGNFFEPFGLEQLTSSKYMTFAERSVTSAFTPVRNAGLMLFDAVDGGVPFTWALGMFRKSDDFGDDKSSVSGEYNVTARVTAAPIYDKADGNVLHFGLAGSVRSDIEGTNTFKTRPESHLAPSIADTDFRDLGPAAFASDGYLLTGAEAAWTRGPLSLQGEYMMADVDAPEGDEDLGFSGYYAMASYFITGEHRPYKKGSFGRVKPSSNWGQGGAGAWEVALRYSAVDLSDGDVSGGELANVTAGVNWYLNPHTRVMFNYVNSELEDSAATASGEGSLDSLIVRFQVDF